ncbi:hypothetical protein [Methanobrevibacter sp.]|uniref:hypothetical protein n=1 Tax=Methanobrevibacter sp. TaxID=66852 RepID=UPI0026DF7982|nr:hypothetical protein [Methanobrevibacter sp.]MDO5823133.1 hypothetical protein [Methanobrevibacter sp.]
MVEKITCNDVIEYNKLFLLAPPFLLERVAKKNSNLVAKFKSTIQSYIVNLTDDEKNKLNVVLSCEVCDLQEILYETYLKTNIKQYKILSNPNHREFIELNLDELKKLI